MPRADVRPAPRRGGAGRRHGWWARFSESLSSRLWPIPLTAIITAVVLGLLLPRADLIVDSSLPEGVDSVVFNGGAQTARAVLSSIAGSLITATSLTFSLTVVALQLASSQASPRVLRLFASDRQVHATLALFLGTFAYSLAVLRTVRSPGEDGPEFVPRLAVTLAFLLTLASVVMLVFFLAHLAAQLRVETMLKEIHKDTDAVIDLVGEQNRAAVAYRHPFSVPSDAAAVTSGSSGFVNAHDHARLIARAREHGIAVAEAVRVGENVVEGMPLAMWWITDATGEVDAEAVDRDVRRAFSIGYERRAAEDIGYGIQQITDIALRALSPGVNDPTTAVHALGHLSALTSRRLSMPRLPAALAGSDGELRVVTRSTTIGEEIEAALDGIRHVGADQATVVRRFVQTIDELSRLARTAEVDAALGDQLDALVEQVKDTRGDPATRARLRAMIVAARRDLRGRRRR